MTDSDNGTSGRVELTDELLGRLVAEAEDGYPVERVRRRARRGRLPAGPAELDYLGDGIDEATRIVAEVLDLMPEPPVRGALNNPLSSMDWDRHHTIQYGRLDLGLPTEVVLEIVNAAGRGSRAASQPVDYAQVRAALDERARLQGA